MSQIKTRYVEDNAIIGSKIRLNNNETLRARNSTNASDVSIAKLTQTDVWQYQTIPELSTALPVPSAPKQVATVEYIKNYLNSKGDPKDSVNLLSATNIPLSSQAPLTIDGAVVQSGFRIALVGQSSAADNGIYEAAVAGSAYTLTRTPDANSNTSVTTGMFFLVSGGNHYQGYEVLLTTGDPINLGSTPLNFVKYPSTLSQIAGDMLARTGTTWSIDLAEQSGLESTQPGENEGKLKIKVDSGLPEKDQTLRIDPVSGALVTKRSKKHTAQLTNADVTNQYVDLADVAGQDSVRLSVYGAPDLIEGYDYNVAYTGGAGGKTRIVFTGELAAGGESALVKDDLICIQYFSF